MKTYTMNDMCVAGCTSRRGVRYWEAEGLLGAVERSKGGTRQYNQDQVDKAKIIAAAQFGGWSLDQCKDMLAEWGEEAREALVIRLADQATVAFKLAEGLPLVDQQEFDL